MCSDRHFRPSHAKSPYNQSKRSLSFNRHNPFPLRSFRCSFPSTHKYTARRIGCQTNSGKKFKILENPQKQAVMAAASARLSGSALIGKTSPLFILILLVLGGIYGGVFTPTEAGAVGALGALIIALMKRKLDRGTLWKVLAETGHIFLSGP